MRRAGEQRSELIADILSHGSAIFLAAVIAGLAASSWTDLQFRKEAAIRGHAEYYLDENEDIQWRWKEPPGGN